MDPGPHQADQADTLTGDLPCIECEYNLRGLSREGTCPECGRAIADSLRGGKLPFANPRWIHRIASGCGWIAAGLILAVLNCEVSGLAPLCFLIFDLLPVGMILLGVWWFSEPEASPLTPTEYEAARRWVRPTVLIWAGVTLALMAVQHTQPTAVVSGVGTVDLVVSGLAVFVVCQLGHALAKRMDEPKLARSARLVGRVWLGVSLTLAMLGLVAVTVLSSPAAGPSASGPSHTSSGSPGMFPSNQGHTTPGGTTQGAPHSGGGGSAMVISGTYVTIHGQQYPAPDWAWAIMIPIGLILLIFGIWLLVLPFQFRSRLRAFAHPMEWMTSR